MRGKLVQFDRLKPNDPVKSLQIRYYNNCASFLKIGFYKVAKMCDLRKIQRLTLQNSILGCFRLKKHFDLSKFSKFDHKTVNTFTRHIIV